MKQRPPVELPCVDLEHTTKSSADCHLVHGFCCSLSVGWIVGNLLACLVYVLVGANRNYWIDVSKGWCKDRKWAKDACMGGFRNFNLREL